jgi:uncharacterized membrane protein YsdA (DUF1294 family)
MRHFLAYLLVVNVVAFLAMGFDKLAAIRGGWRVRERTLLGFAALGGFAGIFAATRTFRHKTLKQPFRGWLLGVSAIAAVWMSLLARNLLA